ncbi:MAG TPA: 4-alpha-glucanotransferase, partial [Elusimicrobiota bacterium]|nr:4-alpha-glucanotransferase [Elusimicrobiota bacterium]
SIAILSVQLLLDWLSVGASWNEDPWTYRINFPGTLGDHNWTLRLPVSLEELQGLPVNGVIREINRASGRV